MNANKLLKQKQKDIKKAYLNDINITLYEVRQANNSRIPYNMVAKIVIESKDLFPWVTHNIINKLFNKFLITKDYDKVKTSTNINTINLNKTDHNKVAQILTDLSTSNQYKEGQPKDSTVAKEKFYSCCCCY